MAERRRRYGSSPFDGARRARPTQEHRPAVWEGILGTVYAMNAAREIRAFDYDYEAARRFAGVEREGADPRLAPHGPRVRYGRGNAPELQPRRGQPVLWIRDEEKEEEDE